MIEVVREPTDEVLAALSGLVPQLSGTAAQLSRDDLESIVASEAVTLLVARDEQGSIVGTLSLVVVAGPAGVRASIEDVVVDRAARGKGVGAELVTEAIERARASGARDVDLTSRPTREAANRLYERLGFELRTTNAYRYRL